MRARGWREKTLVKACVILERGAMFKFPDDSRTYYFNSSYCLPSNVLGGQGYGRLSARPMSFTSHCHLNLWGSGRQTRKKEVHVFLQFSVTQVHLHSNRLFSLTWQGFLSKFDRVNAHCHCLKLFGKGFGRTIFRFAATGFPYCIRAATNWGHMLINTDFSSPAPHSTRPRFGWLCSPDYRALIFRWKSETFTLPGWQQPMTWWCTLSCKIKWISLWKVKALIFLISNKRLSWSSHGLH